MNKQRPIPTTFKKERRKSKALPLRKLILTGSLMAEAQRDGIYPDRTLSGTWDRLLEQCREEGLLDG